MRYERILAAVAATPWAIEPAKGRVIAEVLSLRAVGGEVSPGAVADVTAGRRGKPQPRAKTVALIPVYGVLTQRASLFTEVSGMASTEEVGRLVDEAAADSSVDAIVLDIDSPGGSVYGVAELGAKVAAAGEKKKVVAVANSVAASGAYWIASQARELVVTPSGQVGSIGVFMMHLDRSKEMELSGQSVTFVYAGERKAVNNEFAPLDEPSRAELQDQVRGYYDLFVRAVAKGRDATPAKVREGFGRGGMVLAEDAKREGMADRVATLDDVLARYGVTPADVAPAASAGRREANARRRRLLID